MSTRISRAYRFFIISALVIFSSSVSSDEGNRANDLERKAGKVECQDELRLCSYISQNLSARQLIARLNPVMFPDIPLDPREGFINQESSKKITFWFNTPEIKQRFIDLLPHFDNFEDYSPTAIINFTTEIFAATDEALTQIYMSLGLSNNGATPSTGGHEPGISVSFGIGNFLLSAALSAQRVYNRVTKVTTVTQTLPNLSDINYSHTTTIFVSPTAGVSKEQIAGLKLRGGLSINRQNRDHVLVKDFSLFYGVEVPAASSDAPPRVAVLEFNNPELYLVDGVSNVVVSSNSFEMRRNLGLGLPSTVDAGTISTKLIVITRAKAMSFEEFLDENRDLRKQTLHRKFSQDEVNAFPADDVPLKDIFNSVAPTVKTSMSGERSLSFVLDRQLARKNNYSRSYKIKISAPGFKQEEVRSMENLMLSGVKLEDLPSALMQKPLIKLKVKFKPFNKWGPYKYKKVLYYNPETNEFI